MEWSWPLRTTGTPCSPSWPARPAKTSTSKSRSRYNTAEDAVPGRAILFGAHGSGFLVAHDHFFLRIPVNGPTAEAQRHVAEVADGRCTMAQFQIAERPAAGLDAIDPIALV